MTRILMTTDTVGGVWDYSLELARALGRHGASVVLATMGAPVQPAQWEQVRALHNVELRESEFALEWMPSPWRDVDRAGEWLLDLEVAVAPDLIHLNGYVHGALPWRAPVVIAAHSCVRSWWEAVKGEAPHAEWDEYSRRVEAGLRSADAIVAPSHAMAAALRRHYDFDAEPVVVPNGRAGPFHQGEKSALVLTAGRVWDEAKNVAALARVADTLPWPVYVAGSADSPTGRSAALGAMRPLGQLPSNELAEWMARAAIYALPARYEPFGLSVLEAALSGCALVLGDIPSLRERWDDAALFVDPNDDHALAAAITLLAEDAPMRGALAARARRVAVELTPERMAVGYLSVYRRAIGMERRSRSAACAS